MISSWNSPTLRSEAADADAAAAAEVVVAATAVVAAIATVVAVVVAEEEEEEEDFGVGEEEMESGAKSAEWVGEEAAEEEEKHSFKWITRRSFLLLADPVKEKKSSCEGFDEQILILFSHRR